ncbi:hypothetical protein A2348_02890 [Candidatus Uhrbacteria bacterium RIFOXYB12_FULL_58_10]|uniref:Uncharacterized protein n=1 Tax=Candidatus Uhrbacteria bacterium RIFOXYB2_FULL_57_15 TaxID=1802422 RepID=A0A1F7W8M7_9BACT|nr:MAG: hypothetical protein A2348_02890 [Candidatus Uhrbacteria bacterium RIFOXYB12_FULL_58_10]OGL98444.1 MAG: hypothetical protein A2304_02000 [Candidatus Uhrbacteria bacterium RIFOXYB2_FULL_57_15]OGL99241.1 MAG: hypothetical protein A2501_03535 [Candidatus Uhrbacteria bacterium RIFOXYC12_FULL_57_11]
MLASSATPPLAFPADVAAAREERAFDCIVSVELRSQLPSPRMRIRTTPGGTDLRWLTNAVIVLHAVGAIPVVGRVTQWRDVDSRDVIVTLGDASTSLNGLAEGQMPQEGFVTVLSGGRSRRFPLHAP